MFPGSKEILIHQLFHPNLILPVYTISLSDSISDSKGNIIFYIIAVQYKINRTIELFSRVYLLNLFIVITSIIIKNNLFD